MIKQILNKRGSLLNLASEYLTEQDYLKFQGWYTHRYSKMDAYDASIKEYLNYKNDKKLITYVFNLKFQEALIEI
ncbi:hypothetical protein [Clostridioides difficile]|uniref:hypothetical protein n=1 Tax=Clostridioides difficile TaxID=1496 RepID=UPI000CF2A178|nr:hypothetical protein [Clostridioides difficile]AWH83414.1 hypothetical protein DDG63_20485 [Clostridioides difficile]EGT5015195.1 hypothetical protein [Clostridioides difficile]EJX3365479.1 hypothetical protein [Clostridioides difficile]EJX3378002.1 hypothetical protein [Clostridioides difficile]MBN6006826.1 hypothetical protein [Clostridioides difficile]